MGIKAAGAYLRQLREGTERSRAWVTRYVDADERQIGRIEAGEIDSRASLVFALAQLLGADLPTLQTMMLAPDDEATLTSLDAVVPQQPSTERHSTLAPARHDQPDRSGEHGVSSRSARAPKQFTYQAGQFVPTSFSWPVDAADEEDADAVQWRTVLRAAGFDPAPLMTFGQQDYPFAGAWLHVHQRSGAVELVSQPVEFFVEAMWDGGSWQVLVTSLMDLMSVLNQLVPLVEAHRALYQS